MFLFIEMYVDHYQTQQLIIKFLTIHFESPIQWPQLQKQSNRKSLIASLFFEW